MDDKNETKPIGQLTQIEEARIRDHLGEMVRGTVEEALDTTGVDDTLKDSCGD
jgi:hypothetical protein